MPLEDDEKKRLKQLEKELAERDEEGGEEGTGGKTGAVQFRDFLEPGASRDDQLSPAEIKRLLMVHQETHEAHVKKQKDLGDLRKQLREGKISNQQYLQGLIARGINFKAHRILAHAAQFSGINDKKVNPVPTEHEAEINDAKRQQLQYQKQHRHEHVPRFNPKPPRPR